MEFLPDQNEIRMREVPWGVSEIFSGKQDLSELRIQRVEYFGAGVKSCWLAPPALKTTYVFYSQKDDEIYAGIDLSKDKNFVIEIELAEIFN